MSKYYLYYLNKDIQKDFIIINTQFYKSCMYFIDCSNAAKLTLVLNSLIKKNNLQLLHKLVNYINNYFDSYNNFLSSKESLGLAQVLYNYIINKIKLRESKEPVFKEALQLEYRKKPIEHDTINKDLELRYANISNLINKLIDSVNPNIKQPSSLVVNEDLHQNITIKNKLDDTMNEIKHRYKDKAIEHLTTLIGIINEYINNLSQAPKLGKSSDKLHIHKSMILDITNIIDILKSLNVKDQTHVKDQSLQNDCLASHIINDLVNINNYLHNILQNNINFKNLEIIKLVKYTESNIIKLLNLIDENDKTIKIDNIKDLLENIYHKLILLQADIIKINNDHYSSNIPTKDINIQIKATTGKTNARIVAIDILNKKYHIEIKKTLVTLSVTVINHDQLCILDTKNTTICEKTYPNLAYPNLGSKNLYIQTD